MYTDIGFDENLNLIDQNSNQSIETLDPTETDTFIQQMSGSKIQGGALSSPNGKIKLDLDNGSLIINDGVQELVRLGILPDGTIGLLLKDKDGNILLQIGGNSNLLQSSNKHMVLDFTNENISVTDDQNIKVLKLGKIA